MELWEILEQQLIAYKDISSSIRNILISYENECSRLIKEIKNTTFDDSQILFDRIYLIQNELMCVKYKFDFKLNEKLNNFIYYFERDDFYSRKFWYEKFKNGLDWPSE